MKAKDKFLNTFNKVPKEARECLVHRYWVDPMNLNVCAEEIKHDTKLGKNILKELGYKDD